MQCKHPGRDDPENNDCPCSRCSQARAKILWLKRVVELEERLKKAGIYPEELADVVWRQIEPNLSGRIDRMVRDAVRDMLKGIHLRSEVVGSSVDWNKQ
jgi:hypothetical protein